MKLSAVISTSQTDFSALAYQGNFRDDLKKIASLGYDGVELAIRNPKDVDAREILRLTKDCRLEPVALGTGQAYGQEGLSFTHPDETMRKHAVERIKSHVALAAQLKAQVIIGLIRGKVEPGGNRSQCEVWMKECLAECLRCAETANVDFVLEPLNRYETNLINTVSEAAALIEELSSRRCRILFDSFHMNIEEVSIEGTIGEFAGYIGHVHVADSNRWAPGMGHFDFTSFVRALERAGYDGYLSAEIIPQPSADAAVRQTIEYFRPMVHKASCSL